jgi:hypothetical protein
MPQDQDPDILGRPAPPGNTHPGEDPSHHQKDRLQRHEQASSQLAQVFGTLARPRSRICLRSWTSPPPQDCWASAAPPRMHSPHTMPSPSGNLVETTPATHRSYAQKIEHYLIPALGHHRIDRLRVRHTQDRYTGPWNRPTADTNGNPFA